MAWRVYYIVPEEEEFYKNVLLQHAQKELNLLKKYIIEFENCIINYE